MRARNSGGAGAPGGMRDVAWAVGKRSEKRTHMASDLARIGAGPRCLYSRVCLHVVCWLLVAVSRCTAHGFGSGGCPEGCSLSWELLDISVSRYILLWLWRQWPPNSGYFEVLELLAVPVSSDTDVALAAVPAELVVFRNLGLLAVPISSVTFVAVAAVAAKIGIKMIGN